MSPSDAYKRLALASRERTFRTRRLKLAVNILFSATRPRARANRAGPKREVSALRLLDAAHTLRLNIKFHATRRDARGNAFNKMIFLFARLNARDSSTRRGDRPEAKFGLARSSIELGGPAKSSEI